MALLGTSIYIENSRLARFQAAASRLAVSETELLSFLIQRSRRIFGKAAVIKRTVSYQRGCDPAEYSIHHIDFYDTDYEFAVGRRYLFKISVSFLIRLAIDRFLDEIVRDWLEKPREAASERKRYLTNFHYRNFDVGHFFEFDAENWLITWPKQET